MRRLMDVRVIVATMVALISLVPTLGAQDSTSQHGVLVTGSAIAGLLDHRVEAGAGIERTSGPVFGVQFDASRSSALVLTVRAVGGTLGARTRAADPRDVGEIDADARMRVLSWLDVRAGVTVRGFSNQLARQRWTQLAVGAESRIPMLDGRIEGVFGAALVPFVSVTGHESPRLAMAASMGVRHMSRRFELGLLYQLERYDFAEQSGVTRAEEHSALLLRAGYRLGIRRATR
jgi:hypothetical protein